MENTYEIKQVTLFTTALCNLNCSYCYICKDKQGNLKLIDDELKEHWDNDIFLNQLLHFDNSIQETLETIELWGGEPFLHIERFLNNRKKWLDSFPHVNKISWSTNFVVKDQVELIQNFINQISADYPERDWLFECQISIDGPKEMNDFGRGKGVTQIIINNFKKLCSIQLNNPHINFKVSFKPTLSRETFQFLSTPEQVKSWFKFFSDNFFLPYKESKAPFSFFMGIFNCASPVTWTENDGKIYANIIKNIALVEDEIISSYPGWDIFHTLVPDAGTILDGAIPKDLLRYSTFNEFLKDNTHEYICNGCCGVLHYSLTLIPHNKYTVCHRGIFDEYVDYCNNLINKTDFHGLSNKFYSAIANGIDWIFSEEQMKKIITTMNQIYCHSHSIWFTDLIQNMRHYALSGIIDSKYQDPNESMKVANIILNKSVCLADNYITTGSWTTYHNLDIPLFFNGAADIIYNSAEKGFHRLQEKAREGEL